MLHRRDFLIATAIAGLAPVAAPAYAQGEAPIKRPIRLVVPFAAGGGVDVFARLLAEKLKEKSGLTVVVENRAGANGSIGGSAVRIAEPDGTTLLFSAATHVMAKQVMRSPPYDPVTDFTPVARVGEAPMLVVMAPNLPFKTIAEVVADARQRPDKWTFATSALGAPGHLATVAFNKLAGLNLTIAPYRGTAPGLTDVAAGHVQLMIDPVLALLPMARSGHVKPLAVTARKRVALAPEIPTAAESGMPGLEYASWYGVWGPKGLPGDAVAWLNKACGAAAVELGASGRLAELGIEPVTGTPEEFAQFIAEDVQRNTELLRSVNFEPV
ncbi:MAG: tripartite tricarboxylate transporter substrate binding protein [Rhodoplanes sp.]|uniref:Bug family tripartite tricarboxylate transporter substrate binding protein n=1 Tax=Rhodoplanes sp. TaxID=1968906 RepID=UPI0017D46D47|nr:tripartite tricarboxylate transporter substrate binding protein [Rhodoplanes sp.]NVO14443.1 tripartite tricarboxylate transporter substrate binding protein [Rhodoplanes sp.]